MLLLNRMIAVDHCEDHSDPTVLSTVKRRFVLLRLVLLLVLLIIQFEIKQLVSLPKSN
jgi:hypothetical protein